MAAPVRVAAQALGDGTVSVVAGIGVFGTGRPASPIDRCIGIGGSLAAPPLPHHRTYGSVYGGSVDYAVCGTATEARPSDLKKTIGIAMVSAGLFAIRHGPCGLPAVCAAKSRPTPRRRSLAKRVRP